MGYVLLWIESLAVSLLLVAALVACLAQFRSGPLPWIARPLALVIALVPCLFYAALTIYVKGIASGHLFLALAILTAAYALGAGWLLVRGLWWGADQGPVRAAAWPRGRLGVALLAAAALHLMTFWNLDLAARQQATALRIEAGALALSVAPPRLPDRDNAAIVYQQAFQAMGRSEASPGGWQWEDAWQKAWDEKWTTWQDSENDKLGFDPHGAELQRFLKRQSPALALLRQAAARPGCSFDRDYGRPSLAMPLPELQPLRSAARLLALDAVSRGADKEFRSAVDDVNAMFRIAEHAGTDPLLVSAMFAMAIERSAIDTLHHVLAFGQVPPEDLAAVQFPETSFHTLLRRAFRSEEAFSLATFGQVGEGQLSLAEISGLASESKAPVIPSLPASLYRVVFLSDDIAAQARLAARLRWLAGLPYAQADKEMREYAQELKTAPGGLLTGQLIPAVGTALQQAACAEARRGTARLGLALYAYRARHGRVPEKLDDLAPEFIAAVPHDPFDGEAMKLKQNKHGLIVYSIGPDMKDDGGAPFNSHSKTGDITFTVP